MDSAGMGAIINYFVSCQRHGKKLVVAGVNGRVMELFRMTKVDGLLTLAPTVAEAERGLKAARVRHGAGCSGRRSLCDSRPKRAHRRTSTASVFVLAKI